MRPPAKKEAAFGYEPKAADATIPNQNNTMKNDHVQVLRFKKLKGGGIIGACARHNLREIQAELGADSHIDPLRTSLNIILRGAGAASDVAVEAANLMRQADIRLRNAQTEKYQSVVGIEFIASLPLNSGINERAYFERFVGYIEERFEIPVVSAVIHNDEAAPHCHVITVPLFNGRLIGSSLIGYKSSVTALQADFHAKVGQAYGLTRQAPAKQHSATVRANAALSIVKALQRSPKALNDPAIRDALRDALTISLPANLLALLNLDMPKIKPPKPQTFAGIMTQNKPERKNKKPIGNIASVKPIGNIAEIKPEKQESLSCVGFISSAPIPEPTNPSVSDDPDDDYTRERETEQTVGYWDSERGEYVRTPSPRTRKTAPAIEQTRARIISLQERRSA